MSICDRCSSFGLRFERQYAPQDFLEGDPNSKIWVIGLNPKQDVAWIDPRQISELRNYFHGDVKVHAYFERFRNVSEKLYSLFGRVEGAAHTDLVKCASSCWPPTKMSPRSKAEVISNCVSYLEQQIETYRPELIVCNGAEVSSEIRRFLQPPSDTLGNATSYVHTREDGSKVSVVLSGFIGRIDNYARRRLGIEIESLFPAEYRDRC